MDWLGIKNDHLISAFFLPTIFILILYLGPNTYGLVNIILLTKNDFKSVMSKFPWYNNILRNPHVAFRNYVIGPLFEEFYFRICMIPLLIGSDCSYIGLFVLSALIFGAAHIHHLYYHLKRGANLRNAILGTCILLIFSISSSIYINIWSYGSLYLYKNWSFYYYCIIPFIM